MTKSTAPATGHHRELTVDLHHALLTATARLADEFAGTYGRQTIERWTDEILQAADVVITMGCGDACPVFPGRTYQDWDVPDLAGKGIEQVRVIRDDIEQRVRHLLGRLHIPAS